MPRNKTTKIQKLNLILTKLPNNFTINRKKLILTCCICKKEFRSIKLQVYMIHLKSDKHQLRDRILKLEGKNLNKTESSNIWVKAFGGTGIPLNNMRKPVFRNALKDLDPNLPSVNSVRKKLFLQFQKNINLFTSKCFNEKIYVICDETQKRGLKYFAVLIGLVKNPGDQFLVNLKVGNYKCDSQFVIDSLTEAIARIKVQFSNLSLVITDAVSYNLLAKKIITEKYKNVSWVTCFSHMLHNCCSFLSDFYSEETRLIILLNDFIKRSQLKAKAIFNGLNIPSLVMTRWGSWLEVVEYYSLHSQKIISIILGKTFELNSERNKKIYDVVIKNRENLNFASISANYGFLRRLIERSEIHGFSIQNAGDIMQDIEFNQDPAELKKYLNQRIVKNDLFKLYAQESGNAGYSGIIHCPSTSVDIERLFSHLNNLTSSARNFKNENVLMYLSSININSQSK